MSKINFKIVFFVLGMLLSLEGIFMLLPLGISLFYGEQDTGAFLIASLLAFIVGGGVAFICREHNKKIGKREGFFIVASAWIIFSFFGMLPFLFSGAIKTVADAFFETMSGFTTTGATIIPDIESLPHGILFWRSIIQWLGGMGIVLFTVAIMPMLNSGGGIQLYNAEVPGVKHDKLRPRISQTAKRLWGLYVLLTLILVVLLSVGPMNVFDAVCHAFTTMATGGYSTKQASVAYWDSAYIDYVITLFMLIAGTNFSLFYFAATGKFKKFFQDEELRNYLLVAAVFTAICTIGLIVSGQTEGGLERTFRLSLFQVVSLLTTTGYATADYVVWGGFFSLLMLLVMFPGACAGSTSGGIKIARISIIIKNIINEFYIQVHPNAIKSVRLNNNVISHEMISKVASFIFVYITLFFVAALSLTALGIPLEESLGASITSLSNVGPGLGMSGPSGNFAHFPDLGKWILSFVMLIGRLELFTVLIIFTPYFWKR